MTMTPEYPAAPSAPVPENRGRVALVGEALAVVGIVAGMIILLRAVDVTYYRGPIAIVCAALAATWFLKRRGQSWSDVGMALPLRWRHAMGYACLAIVLTYLTVGLFQGLLLPLLGLPAPNLSAETGMRGDPVAFAMRLLIVGWGTAAFAEEMVARGFVMTRLAAAFGDDRRARSGAAVAQAVLFGAGHLSQGPTGMVLTGLIGLVMAFVFYRARCSLWPCIIAHGLIDTLGLSLIFFGLLG
jgi:membrane protease YdiL (CAAX protease family)